jgi:hypothetical protein
MTRSRQLAALAIGVLAFSPAACAPDATPTAPMLRDAPATSRGSEDEVALDPSKAADEAAKRAAKAAQRASKEADKAAFDALRDDWRAYKDSVKHRLVEATMLRCEPLPAASASRTIGPKGGELHVGPHRLFVPAGALDAPVVISGATVNGSRREVEFAPHGLTFQKPVRLVLDYDKCLVPAGAALQIVYTGQGNRILAEQPSLDLEELEEVEGWTDHFSGYAVAYGRKK